MLVAVPGGQKTGAGRASLSITLARVIIPVVGTMERTLFGEVKEYSKLLSVSLSLASTFPTTPPAVAFSTTLIGSKLITSIS